MTGVDGVRVARLARQGRSILGLVLGLVARAWLRTLRVRVVEHPGLAVARERPWVLAFFHGTQWPLLAWRRRRPTVVMVSWSLDGELQARALGIQGLSVVRGSSSNGGMRALVKLAQLLREGGRDAAFAVDGPKGPYGVAKGGAVLAASSAHGVLVPLGSAFASGFVIDGAWDRFGVAWPFSRVVVCLGEPIEPCGHAGRVLAEAIARANQRAAEELVDRRAPEAGAMSRHSGPAGTSK